MYPLNLDVIFEEKDDLNDNDFVPKSSEPILLNQEELSDLIRGLNLSKESSELWTSRLNDRNLPQQGTKINFYRTNFCHKNASFLCTFWLIIAYLWVKKKIITL